MKLMSPRQTNKLMEEDKRRALKELQRIEELTIAKYNEYIAFKLSIEMEKNNLNIEINKLKIVRDSLRNNT